MYKTTSTDLSCDFSLYCWLFLRRLYNISNCVFSFHLNGIFCTSEKVLMCFAYRPYREETNILFGMVNT